MDEREELQEAAMREVEREERERSWFELFLFLVLGGVVGFVRAQIASMRSSGRERPHRD